MTRNNLRNRSALIFLIALLATVPASAQGNKGVGGSQVGIAAPNFVTVTGVVTNVDFVYGEGHPNFELLSNGISYVIYVGPLRYIDNSGFELQHGDNVTAIIFPDLQNNFWVAAGLTNLTTNQTLTLRDAAGIPLWTASGTVRHAGPGSMRIQGPTALGSGVTGIDLSTLQEYRGTVVQVNILAGAGQPTVTVRLVNGDIKVFCLAPYRYLTQIGLKLELNNEVLIKAADCPQDPTEFVVFELTTNGKTYPLRSSDGTPLWYFGARK